MPAPTNDILTYRYNGHYAYVDPGKDYQEGVRNAKEAFPELEHVSPDRITICVNGVVNQERQHIRITARSWNTVISKLRRYEILDVLVNLPSKLPDIVVVDSAHDLDALPDYDDVKEKSESDDFLVPSRQPSPHMKPLSLEAIRAVQAQRHPHTRSRSSSPSKPPSPNTLLPDWAKSIFGKSAPQ